MNDLVILVICHLIGDYVLQSDFIAKTKGQNWYHLFVHCALYCVPFMIIADGQFPYFIFATHFIVDAMKARYNKVAYLDDQILHYACIGVWMCARAVM